MIFDWESIFLQAVKSNVLATRIAANQSCYICLILSLIKQLWNMVAQFISLIVPNKRFYGKFEFKLSCRNKHFTLVAYPFIIIHSWATLYILFKMSLAEAAQSVNTTAIQEEINQDFNSHMWSVPYLYKTIVDLCVSQNRLNTLNLIY